MWYIVFSPKGRWIARTHDPRVAVEYALQGYRVTLGFDGESVSQ